jgi:hypothetical protein
MMGAMTRAFVRPYRRARPPSRTVAVAVPLFPRSDLLAEEQVSLRHLQHFLGAYDKFLVAPSGLSVEMPGFATKHFARKFFGSIRAHTQLLKWPGFYRAFEDYEYILIYHPDSLVLSDDLLRWCRAGWDYVGAPWIPCDDTPWVEEARVGNGGFALMRIESALQVLRNRHRLKPASFWLDLLVRNPERVRPLVAALDRVRPLLPRSRFVNNTLAYWHANMNPAPHGLNSDRFWSLEAHRFLPAFKVATVEEGLRFAFETAPRRCFEMNQRRMPFGCHAWARYDRAFWEPHLVGSDDGETASLQEIAVTGVER